MHRVLLSSGLALAVGACATLPEPRYAGLAKHDDISGDLINRLVCDVAQSSHLTRLQKGRPNGEPAAAPMRGYSLKPRVDRPPPEPKPQLPDERPKPPKAYYDIAISFTLKAEATGGLTPTANFIHPFATEGTSRTGILGLEFSQTGSRSVTENFTIDALQLYSADPKTADSETDGEARQFRAFCETAQAKVKGEFGVTQVIDTALGRELPIKAALHDDDTGFGTTIEFSMKQGISAGPHWVRTHFTGPSDSGLMKGARTDTNTLLIAIKKHKEDKPEENSAKEIIDQMILNNLRLFQR